MPVEIIDALQFIFTQKDEEGFQIDERYYLLVDKVREYFNKQKIQYNDFSYYDLKPYL